MSDCVKNIVKIYLFVLAITYILLGKFDFTYAYTIIIVLNSIIGICGFLVNLSYCEFNKDIVYKYISISFAISSVINLIYAFSIFILGNGDRNLNIINIIGFLSIFSEISLLIFTLNHNKTEIKTNKLINMGSIFILVSLFIICRTNILRYIINLNTTNIIMLSMQVICILGFLYIIRNINKIDGKISKRALKDLQMYSIAKLIFLAFTIIVSIINLYVKISESFLYTNLFFINLLNSICILRICYMDIIRRPNQLLHRNLLREKEKLEELNKGYKDYKNRYEEVLMYLPDGVILYENGVIVFANEKINEYFNLEDTRDIIGMRLEDIVDRSELESIKNINDITNPITYSNLKYRFNGVEFYGEQTNIIRRKKKKILSVSIIKNMEDKIKLAKIKEELEYNKTMEEIKNQVLANISHDFKTPINVIYSTVQMQDLNINKQKYDSLINFNEIIKQNCNKLIRLINNFIDSIKLEDNILSANLKYVNIVSLVEDITTSVLNYAKEKDINLVFDTDSEEIYTSTDIEFMEKIMLNLLSNAIKYNKVGGKIDVKVEETKKMIIISVKDSGIGIPREKIKSVFNRFERADRTSIETKEGSGIGLNIVKQMVEALNGAIDISSVENIGTVVKIIFQKDNKAQYDMEDVNSLDIENLDEKTKLELSDI